MSEDRARILQMVSEGKIDASQGVELLSALNSENKPDGPAAPTSTGKARKIALVLGAGPRSWAARRWGKGPGDEPRNGLWTRARA